MDRIGLTRTAFLRVERMTALYRINSLLDMEET